MTQLENPTLEQQTEWMKERPGLREEISSAEHHLIVKLARILGHLTETSPLHVSVNELAPKMVTTKTLTLTANAQKIMDRKDNRVRVFVGNKGANPAYISGWAGMQDGQQETIELAPGDWLPPMNHQAEMFGTSAAGTTLAVLEELAG